MDLIVLFLFFYLFYFLYKYFSNKPNYEGIINQSYLIIEEYESLYSKNNTIKEGYFKIKNEISQNTEKMRNDENLSTQKLHELSKTLMDKIKIFKLTVEYNGIYLGDFESTKATSHFAFILFCQEIVDLCEKRQLYIKEILNNIENIIRLASQKNNSYFNQINEHFLLIKKYESSLIEINGTIHSTIEMSNWLIKK